MEKIVLVGVTWFKRASFMKRGILLCCDMISCLLAPHDNKYNAAVQ